MHRTSALTIVTIVFASLSLTACSSVAGAIVDTSAPDLELLLSDGRPIVNGTVIYSAHMDIVCLALDDMSGIQSVTYSIDGGAFKDTDSLGDLHRTTITLSGLEEGDHALVVRATNSANLTSEKSVDFSLNLSVVAPSSNTGWIILTGSVAVFGFLLAVFLIFSNRRKRGESTPKDDVVIDPRQRIL